MEENKESKHVEANPAELERINRLKEDRKKNEQKRRRKARQQANAKSKEAKAIRKFLEQVSFSEELALKSAILSAASCDSGVATIADEYRKTINAYLNTGYKLYASFVNAVNVREHRTQQAQKLMAMCKEYLSPDEFCSINVALYELVNRDAEVNALVKKRTAITVPNEVE